MLWRRSEEDVFLPAFVRICEFKKAREGGNPGKCASVCEGGLKLFNEF